MPDPGAGVDHARAYLVEQMTRAAQATVPLGQIVVVSNEVDAASGNAVGYILVMATDQTRPHSVDELAAAAAVQLQRLGWVTSMATDGDYWEVRAEREDRTGFGISVLCNAENPVSQWNGHTPGFAVPAERQA